MAASAHEADGTTAPRTAAMALGTEPTRAGAWRVLALCFGGLSLAQARRIGLFVGWLAGSVLRIRRRHVERSMRAAGLASPRELARRMYSALGRGAAELLWMAGARRDLEPLVRMNEPTERLFDRALAAGRGVVLAASHTGNWDLAACAVATRAPLLVVTKRLHSPRLDALWQSTRAGYGVELCEAVGATDRVRDHLARGGAVAMMIDQVPLREEHAVRTTFLGQDAWVDRAPAVLAARAGAPLLVSACSRRPDGVAELHALALFEPPPRAGRAWIVETTRAATESLDRFVRAHPEDWLWMHRRWRAPLRSANADRRRTRAALAR